MLTIKPAYTTCKINLPAVSFSWQDSGIPGTTCYRFVGCSTSHDNPEKQYLRLFMESPGGDIDDFKMDAIIAPEDALKIAEEIRAWAEAVLRFKEMSNVSQNS